MAEQLIRPLVTQGAEALLRLDGKYGYYASDDTEQEFYLPNPLLLRHYIQYIDQPVLTTNIGMLLPTGLKPKAAHQNLLQEIGVESPLRNHLLQVGKGKNTWYGLISNDLDPASFVEAGRRQIQTAGDPSRQSRRHQVFDAIELRYDPKQDHRFSRTQLVGAGAIVVAVGGFVSFYIHRSKGS